MAIEIHQNLTQDLRLSQELIMTPQLQQAIKLLQLTRMELLDKVQEQLEENPLLEEVVETDYDTAPVEAKPAETNLITATSDERANAETDWEQYLNQYESPPQSDRPMEIPEDRSYIDSLASQEMTLQDHLMWQLKLSEASDEEQTIGMALIGNIDEDGYLIADVAELAAQLGNTFDEVEDVLSLIQQFEPNGVGSRDLRECLLRQAHDANESQLVVKIIDKGLALIETRNFKKLAKLVNADIDDVMVAVRRISEFEPRPGRDFTPARVDCVIPDVLVTKREDEYFVVLYEEGLPKLRVSPYYKTLSTDSSKEGEEAKSYIQERMQAADWLIKAIKQRQETLLKTSKSIVKFQREFFDEGLSFLKPLILKDVAEDIGMHESTVSRVTTGKYMQTPRGTFELKYFFSSAIKRESGEDLASKSVKARIKEIISKENPKKPLSDIEIGKILAREYSLKIARRTVTKYRESMGILSSSARKSLF